MSAIFFFTPEDRRRITCQKIFNELCKSTLRTQVPSMGCYTCRKWRWAERPSQASLIPCDTQPAVDLGVRNNLFSRTRVPRQVDMESSQGQADLRLAHILSSSKQGDDVDPPLTPLPAISERNWLTRDTVRQQLTRQNAFLIESTLS